MQCPNCGAELDDQLICPYCGYENEKAAQQRNKKELAAVYEKIAAMLHAPVDRTRKILRGLKIGAVALVCVFCLAFLGALIYSHVAPERAFNKQQSNLEQLEVSYQAGDYEQMNRLLDKIDGSYKAVYDKYTIIGRLYKNISRAEENAVSYAQNVKINHCSGDFLQYPMMNLFKALNECRELEENGFVYDEDTEVLAFDEQIRSVLRDVFMFTEEEIGQGLELQQEEEPDYSALCEISAQRLRGDSQ